MNEPKQGVLPSKGCLPNGSALLGLFLAPDKEGCCRHHRSQGRCRQQKQDDGGPIGVHRCGGETGAIISAEVPELALRRSVLVAGLTSRRCLVLGRWVLLGFALAMDLAIGSRTQAGVVFDNCQTLPGGAVSCDTRPTHNTLANDEAARYGLFDEASPGWSEFDPDEGYNSMAGLNQY